MSIGEAMDDALGGCNSTRVSGAREALVIVVLAYGLAQSGEALADQAASFVEQIQPMAGCKPVPMAFAMASPASEFEPSTDFQRRRPNADYVTAAPDREPAFRSQPAQTGSAWQHLGDYRAQGRVQLLTLWQSSRNMLSLQTGKHGGPSLQWNSRVMNRGGATRGVLDRFVASSLGAAGLGSKASKTPSPIPATKAP